MAAKKIKKGTTKVRVAKKSPAKSDKQSQIKSSLRSLLGVDLQLTEGYVLIEQLKARTQTSSGIYLPDNVGEKPQTGRILLVGADMTDEKGIKRSSPAKVGDKVIFKKWGGNEVKFGSEEFLFVKFEDILAIEK